MKKRIASILLTVCICMTLLPTVAFASSKTADEATEWARSQVGHSVGYNDGTGYYQCVEFIQAYYQWLGVGKPSGNGCDYAYNALPAGWTRTPGGIPQKGDILVYSGYPGHVAIYESDNVLYDQDGSVYGATVKRENKNYRTYTSNYWGCIHPNFTSSAPVSPTVTFKPWENGNYTYIRETDAAIGQEIHVSNGSCGENGIHLYDANGQFLAAAKNNSYVDPKVYFQINAEVGYTLTPGTIYKYKFYAVVNGETYWSDERSFKTAGTAPVVKPTVTFKPWSNNNYTYIGETDAAIGQEILVSNGSCGENGIYLYDTRETFLAAGRNDSYTLSKVYFKINDECGYTLTPGTTYKYKFYAVVNGEYYWSDWGTFKTAGLHPTANYSISLNRSSLSLEVGEKDTLSATVSPSGPVVKWTSSDESVASVTDGRVIAVGEGKATITAAAAGKAATCAVTVSAGVPTPSVPSSGSWETEDNNKAEVADSLQLDTPIGGYITSASDVDWFEFSLPSAGTVEISFEHNYIDSSQSCWHTYLYTAGNEKISSMAWKGNATGTSKSGRIGLNAGTYYLCVKQGAAKCYGVDYQTAIEFMPSNDWETEFNNSAETADIIAPGNEICGSIMDASDKDWYAFTLPASGTVHLSFGHDFIGSSQNCWYTYLYDANKKKIDSIGWKGNEVNTSESKQLALKAGTYFLCVQPGAAKCYGTTYHFTIENSGNISGVHFERNNTYRQGQFTDVPANQWYTQNVADAYEFGLMKGNSATTFGPYGDLTIAQAVTMAARIHSIYTAGSESFTQTGGTWYQVYMDYAYRNGIVGAKYYNCDATQKATRAQFAEIFANSLPDEALPAINTVADNAIPDVKMSVSYAPSVYKLYRAGILAGSDANGTFNPQTYITRAQAATLVARMAESDTRVSLSLPH